MQGEILVTELKHKPKMPVSTGDFGVEQSEAVRRFHRSFPEYAPTPLLRLKALAKALGVRDIYVKDESKRFGLNAFKVLGGSYAIAREMADCLGLDGDRLTFPALLEAALKARQQLVFVTATDGNHGRGVAWTAGRLGQKAIVYMPKGSSPERLSNIQALGAEASITSLNYDDAVRLANLKATEIGGVMVQDTSWPGYEKIPRHIMQGYTTMLAETVEQLGSVVPTHVFLQAGVGAMSGASASFLADYYKERHPCVTVVEPSAADCIYRTAKADDGRLHHVSGDLDSIMAGLCCGEPCALGWAQLAAYADHFISMPDEVAALGMRVLASPLAGDLPVTSGESGAAGFGLAMAALMKPELGWLKKRLKLDEQAVILCLSTEGDTDAAMYRRIVWEGAFNWQDI